MRAVRDAAGVEWQAWEVRPSWAAGGHGQPPDAPSSRVHRPSLTPGLEGGWLAFRSAVGERRRVVPIPDGWDALDDARLLALIAAAEAQPATHRRPIE